MNFKQILANFEGSLTILKIMANNLKGTNYMPGAVPRSTKYAELGVDLTPEPPEKKSHARKVYVEKIEKSPPRTVATAVTDTPYSLTVPRSQDDRMFLIWQLWLVIRALEKFIMIIEDRVADRDQQIAALQRRLAEEDAGRPKERSVPTYFVTFKFFEMETDLAVHRFNPGNEHRIHLIGV